MTTLVRVVYIEGAVIDPRTSRNSPRQNIVRERTATSIHANVCFSYMGRPRPFLLVNAPKVSGGLLGMKYSPKCFLKKSKIGQ